MDTVNAFLTVVTIETWILLAGTGVLMIVLGFWLKQRKGVRATSRPKLSLRQKWTLEDCARRDYRNARGYTHRMWLKDAKKRLKKEVELHAKELKRLKPLLAAVDEEERVALRLAMEAFLIKSHFGDVHGIGPILKDDILAFVRPTRLADLYGASRVRGVGRSRQAAINAWVSTQQQEILRNPEMAFPGRAELTTRFLEQRKDLQRQVVEQEQQLTRKKEALESSTQAAKALEKTTAKHYVRAAKGSVSDATRVASFERGIYGDWESAPGWFQLAVGNEAMAELRARPAGFVRSSRLAPLELTYHLDLAEDGLHRFAIERKQESDYQTGTPVSLDDLVRYDYVEMSPDRRTLFRVSEHDRHLLLAVQSVGPRTDEAGQVVAAFSPEVLSHLRKHAKVEESPESARLHIGDAPQLHTLLIDYIPAQGLTIKAGYGDTVESMVPASTLAPVNGSTYVRTGNGFAQLIHPKTQAGRKLLEQEVSTLVSDQIPGFFLEELPQLKGDFTILLAENAERIQVTEITSMPIVSTDIVKPGWLGFQVNYDAGTRIWSHREVARAESNGNFQQVGDYEWVKVRKQTIEKVERELSQLGAEVTATGYRIPLAQFVGLDNFITAIDGRSEIGNGYRVFLKDLTEFTADPEYRLGDGLEQDLRRQSLQLRPYQRAGIHWLDWLHTHHLHGLLADDMGLGKTIQALCAVRQAYAGSHSRQHSLIVAPKSVMVHWQRELGRVFPGMPVYFHHGADRRKSRDLLQQNTHPAIFVTTYTTVANDIDFLAQVPFYFLLLDEATNVKNPSAKRTKSIKTLNAQHRIALSGTPVENRPGELWSIFDFLMVGHLGRYGTFERLFEQPILNGDAHAVERLGHRIGPFMLRRQKCEVARDLPEKIEMDEWCELTDEQRTLYKSLQSESERIRTALRCGEQVSYTSSILPLLTKLKQVCDHPAIVTGDSSRIWGRSEKFDLIFEGVRAIRDDREQVVVFSHFLGMLDLLERACQMEGISYVRIDGSTQDRQVLIDRFNRSNATIALCSLMAAGHGINLTAANHVVHADRWWNPAIEAQATDRVHRIGQDKTVYVYRILVQRTLEEWIDAILASKRKMAEQIVGAAGEQQLRWTREELIEILKPLDI